MKAHNKEEKKKNWEIGGKESEDVVVSGHENRSKMKVKRKKKEKLKDIGENESVCEVLKSKKKAVVTGDSAESVMPKSKKAKFSEEVEVFDATDSSKCDTNEGGLVRGKHFSTEENELVRKAVSAYIEANHLGEEGLDMVLHCKLHPRVKDCWRKIGAALPWRPHLSVYQRAHKLFERGEGKWTMEGIEFIRNSYMQYGPKWRMMADELGKHPYQVRHAFQRYKLGSNRSKGKWSQHEYQALFELVNKGLQMSVFEEKKSQYGMLRDNMKWETISNELGTRNPTTCCSKWYGQLTSPMVAEGKWVDSDDYRLIMVLSDLDASCEDEVEWDDLLEHRSGDLCRKRWFQMARHLDTNGDKSFAEQVEVLSERYCPDMADVRETLDARPSVDLSDSDDMNDGAL